MDLYGNCKMECFYLIKDLFLVLWKISKNNVTKYFLKQNVLGYRVDIFDKDFCSHNCFTNN